MICCASDNTSTKVSINFLNNENLENEPQGIVGNNPPNNPDPGTYTICANDTNFPQQWGLENPTNPNIDIDICNAWTISEGANVKVAVLDGGIDFNNLDLNNNILPLSFDTVTGTSPSVMRNPHGIFVSGIIGAIKNNNYQINCGRVNDCINFLNYMYKDSIVYLDRKYEKYQILLENRQRLIAKARV